MPWYHKNYGRHGQQSVEEVTRAWREDNAKADRAEALRKAQADEDARREEADRRRRHFEHLDHVADMTYRRTKREHKRVARANAIAELRGRRVAKRVNDLFHYGKLNAEKRKRDEAAAREQAERESQQAEVDRKQREKDDAARRAREKREQNDYATC